MLQCNFFLLSLEYATHKGRLYVAVIPTATGLQVMGKWTYEGCLLQPTIKGRLEQS